jgi:hypothetical protein
MIRMIGDRTRKATVHTGLTVERYKCQCETVDVVKGPAGGEV